MNHEKKALRSIRTLFLLAMLLLILLLSLPLFLSGSRLLNAIIYELGTELIDEKLAALIEPVDHHYETLRRVGLEDSVTHLEEIKNTALATFAKTRYKQTGTMFVIGPDQSIWLSADFKGSSDRDFTPFLSSLTTVGQGVIEYTVQGRKKLAVCRYYPPWKSYIGLTMDRSELFAAYHKFIAINRQVLTIAIAIAFFFILAMQRLIITPIMRLARFADRVTHGDFQSALQGPFFLELHTLQRDVITMVGTLYRQMRETEQQLTTIKERESELDMEKERLAVTLRSIGDGVITTDTAGRVVMLNKVAEELTGWTQEEAAGATLPAVFRIMDEKTGETCENPANRVLASGSIVGLASHCVLIGRDGTRRRIADTGAPIRDPESRVIGVVLVFRDVTEKLRYEQEILKMKKLESVAVLAGGIAHDFNNILTAILGNINLARFHLKKHSEAAVLLQEAERASQHAKSLTQQLLTFAKGGTPVKQITSIAGLIQESASFVLRGSSVNCVFNIPEDLWLVDIDEGQMSQVIGNIIINARQAMPQGGTITISCRNNVRYPGEQPQTGQDCLEITISDTGPGIPEEFLDRIFDPYFTSKREGSGLGLAISHSIIGNHQGQISVSSPPGQGATFTIVLPACRKPACSALSASQVMAPPASSRARVLVMDDEEIIRSLVQNMLGFVDYQVVLAENGEQAVELYRAAMNGGEPIDALIMDLTIRGGMGGQEAVRRILELDSRARVIVSSGYSNDPIMANYRDYGFCAAVSKPFQLQDLLGALQQALTERV